jgi:hypothetical protein
MKGIMKKSIDQKLFELVDSYGEILCGECHIIQTEFERYNRDVESKVVYRVYHSKGYCLDISKEANFDETDEITGYDYFAL